MNERKFEGWKQYSLFLTFKGSGDSNYSHHESDFDLEESNRESLRRDAERSAALQLERAKVEDIFL